MISHSQNFDDESPPQQLLRRGDGQAHLASKAERVVDGVDPTLPRQREIADQDVDA